MSRKLWKCLSDTHYGTFAETILKNGWVRPNKRIFNNAKVSDHFAIIPTLVAPKHLSEPEQKLYDLVTKRFLAIFYPAAEFLITTRITRVESEPFKSEGKVMVNAGWLAVYGKEAAESDDTPSLVPVKPNENVKTDENRSRSERHQTAGALFGSDVAWRDGRRGQIDRGRGIARGDVARKVSARPRRARRSSKV